jgi:type IV pilus assembly protein PilQ
LTIGTFDVLGNLNAIIGLGETQDLVHILSAPRVVTLSNETADIQQSILVPQPSQVAAGATTTTSTLPVIGVAYHAIKLELKVTPQITAESDVILDVDLSREFVATGSATASSNIESRQAHTKVLVKNGQTAVIGGVYQNDSLVTEAGLPWLKDIPLFGYLFKSVDKSKTKNELLLFLTPRILNAEKGLIKEEAL